MECIWGDHPPFSLPYCVNYYYYVNKHKSHDGIFSLYVIPSVSHTLTNDTVTDNSTAILVCLSSINDISVSFVNKWIGPDNLVISGETDGILIISTMGVDEAGNMYIYC